MTLSVIIYPHLYNIHLSRSCIKKRTYSLNYISYSWSIGQKWFSYSNNKLHSCSCDMFQYDIELMSKCHSIKILNEIIKDILE
jgi:hypothetical protein